MKVCRIVKEVLWRRGPIMAIVSLQTDTFSVMKNFTALAVILFEILLCRKSLFDAHKEIYLYYILVIASPLLICVQPAQGAVLPLRPKQWLSKIVGANGRPAISPIFRGKPAIFFAFKMRPRWRPNLYFYRCGLFECESRAAPETWQLGLCFWVPLFKN